MYRIRRESGEEVNLGSIDEFGAAVAAGIVTAKAEIFHARAEKWLPIASHPHFKMAHDRVTGAAAQKPSARNTAVTSSGQRPALSTSGQRPAVFAPPSGDTTAGGPPRQAAPQLRVMRPESAPAPADATVAEKPGSRWNSAQRPAARVVAPKPAPPPAPASPPSSELRLVRADTLLSSAATAPALPEVEFELLPVLAEPPVRAPVAAALPVAETVVERTPANVELVSRDERPADRRGEVEIINPDRTMPVAHRAVAALDIPAPIRDFAPADSVAPPVAKSGTKAPLFVGIGLVAAAAAVIGFFVLKPSSAIPSTPDTVAPNPSATAPTALQPVASEPVASQPVAAPLSGGPAVAPSAPTGASTGLGGDQARKQRKQPGDAQTASKATIGDGLEPPPEDVLPAAPNVGKIGDAAALPTIDAGAVRNDAMARERALEKTRREIDSSMRLPAAE